MGLSAADAGSTPQSATQGFAVVPPPPGETPAPGDAGTSGGAPTAPTAAAPAAPDGAPAPGAAPADASSGDGAAPATGADGQPLLPPPAERRPGFRERGRMRRRLRYLRRLRELQIRDLGGLAFDLRRFERKRDDLVAQKVDQIRACDDELHALETALAERRDVRDLRMPGIGGTCPRCFSLYGSSDRFCAHCGAALGGLAQGPAQVAAPAPVPVAAQPTPQQAGPPAAHLATGQPAQVPPTPPQATDPTAPPAPAASSGPAAAPTPAAPPAPTEPPPPQ